MSQEIVLITGCSDGGLGSALAIAFHKAGYRVIATARNLKKLSETRQLGIEEIELDVLSQASIDASVKRLEAITGGQLDILINNAGAGYNAPVVDVDLDEARKLFELNVFSLIPITRAFLPALMKSKNPKIANNISVSAYIPMPIQGTYNASKAAANAFTENLRLELAPFGVKVIALITGGVKSQFLAKLATPVEDNPLPEDSIYRVVPSGLKMMQNPEEVIGTQGFMEPETWAQLVVKDLSKAQPPYQIWRGTNASMIRYGSLLPIGMFDKSLMEASKMDEVEKALEQGG